jgi:Uma2 family endonuclease
MSRAKQPETPLPARLTVRDFEELPEDPAYRQELRAGLLIREPPPGMLHSRVQARLVHLLWAHVEPRRLGAVLVDGAPKTRFGCLKAKACFGPL